MNNLAKLFKLAELSRAQVQYGYILGGLKTNQLSNLAEHHYLVTFIAWRLALYVNSKGAKIDTLKVIEYSLIHDLGELFGGDISMPYAKINPKAREHAKAFEAENHNFLSQFFTDDDGRFKSLCDEIMDAHSNEGIIAKIADYLECMHFKVYMNNYEQSDIELLISKMLSMAENLSDEKAKNALSNVIKEWKKEVPGDSILEILYSTNK